MSYVTNTSYGTWNNHIDQYASGLEHSVTEAFGSEGADGFDFDGIVSAYRNAINDALPASVALAGDEFIGPAYTDDQDFDGYLLNEHGELDIKGIVDDIDLWEIVARYELWSADRVAQELGYKTPTANATARKKMSAWGVKAAVHKTNPDSGRVQAYYLSGEVRAAHEARPGQGVGGGKKAQA
ncbi:hypothetical protein [Streptomyces sp. NPDC060366]|uniref:hypothetical protein n=1 Tax=Streptomyces sp. NPDC060366 TaxID=3347105 RepID=UPI0036609F47